MSPPRVTLGVAAHARDAALPAVVAACLQQGDDLEVLVLVEGDAPPAFADPRVRVVPGTRADFLREARGELLALTGTDVRRLPGRLADQVAVFDAHPDTGAVHGDALVVDEQGRTHGRLRATDLTPGPLLRRLVRHGLPLVPPTLLVHRRVLETVEGEGLAALLRAAGACRFRHAGGEPLVAVPAAPELPDTEAALGAFLEDADLRLLVPELDWPVVHPDGARRRALEVLAGDAERRALPRLARRLRGRAAAVPAPPAPRRDKGRLLMTAFGFNDSGGGTTVPRVAAKELARRGWDVTVFHAATGADPSGVPYAVREWEEDGVRLIGVHNREHGLWDLGRPDRELDDPPITAAFAAAMDRIRPDVVHFHNLHNLGAALIDVAAARGVPAHFTTHNYWLVCPRAYLLRGDGALCGGPGSGAGCASCVGSHDTLAHEARLAGIRDRVGRGVRSVLAVSHGVRRTLVDAGYDPAAIDVVRQGVPAQDEVWERVGRDRAPGRVGDVLTVGFFGSAYGHKGPQLLVAAAQRTAQPVRVRIHGELPAGMADRLRALDTRGVVELHGAFSPDELPGLLRGVDAAALPSVWWDCAPLAAGECLAARVPVLAPRMGGLAEAITHEVDGLAFAGGDVDDLAAQLDRLAGEPGLLERLQAQIEAPHGFHAYVDELEATYAGARPSRVVAEPEVAVAWRGDFDKPTSLARINREVTARLHGHVRRVRLDSDVVDAPLPHVADVEVRHAWPPDLRPPAAGRLALIQPWEWGTLPRAWVAPVLEHVDEVWAPSDYVAQQYRDAGVAPDRVHVVPNGVDLDRFTPEGPAFALDGGGVRFLFVGSAIGRKGIDVLLRAWRLAFPAGTEDVSLTIKDFGSGGIYKKGRRGDLEALVTMDPRVQHLTADLTDDEMPALLRAADVLVHPYRGEGFGMPILEAMATGLPVIVTEGGAADEFCPGDAGWRIRAQVRHYAQDKVGDEYPTLGTPWELEPDVHHLAELLREAAASPEARAARGAAGRTAATALSWDRVAAMYDARVRALATRTPRLADAPVAPPLLEEDGPRLVATPAWRGSDRLDDLLAAWAAVGEGTLILVADPAVDGTPEELEAHVLAAVERAGVDLDACPDIAVRMEPGVPGRDARLHAESDAYIPLHAACDGHERQARAAGSAVLTPARDALASWLAARPVAAA